MFSRDEALSNILTYEEVFKQEEVQDLSVGKLINKINAVLETKQLINYIYVDYVCYKEKDTCKLTNIVVTVFYKYSNYRDDTILDISISLLQNKQYVIKLILDAINAHIMFIFAEKNVKELNTVLFDIAKRNDYIQRVKFAVSNESIVDISDETVVFGMTETLAFKLGSLQLFNLNKLNKQGYENLVSDVFKSTIPTYSFITDKNFLSIDLGVYTRRNIINVLKDTFKYKIFGVKEGKVGYLIQDGYFFLLKRLTEQEAKIYHKTCICDEVTHRYYRFVIKPIEVSTGNRVDLTVDIKGGELSIL